MADNVKAISTYGVELRQGSTKLIDIKSFPDLGGAPEMLETTTLSDNMNTYIAGIQSLDALEFEANYNKADYDKLKALEGKSQKYQVWLGKDGDQGKFEFTGELSVYVNGGGVNEVVNMTISIAPSTPIEPVTEGL